MGVFAMTAYMKEKRIRGNTDTFIEIITHGLVVKYLNLSTLTIESRAGWVEHGRRPRWVMGGRGSERECGAESAQVADCRAGEASGSLSKHNKEFRVENGPVQTYAGLREGGRGFMILMK